MNITVYQRSVHTPPPPLSAGGGGVESPPKFSERGGVLTGPQFLEGVAGKDRVTFFRGDLQFLDNKIN